MTINHNSSSLGYTLGLDVGIASVGWAILGEDRIINLGVRAFNKAETDKEGKPLNEARRTARLTRRRLSRRASRLKKLRQLFKEEGINLAPEASSSCATGDKHQVEGWLQKHPLFQSHRQSPWILRVEGLGRKLEDSEWANVIFHICKYRGFHWVSRAEQLKEGAVNNSEGGKVKQGLSETERLMSESGAKTIAEMVLRKFPESQRNKQGDYSKSLSRRLLAKELSELFRHQRKMGNKHAGEEFELMILGPGDKKTGILWEQEPPISGEDLLDMLGHCTFEKHEKRAPKASFSAERHVWLTKLNNLRIIVHGESRRLTNAERNGVLHMPYQKKGKLTYKQLKTELIKKPGIDDDFRFSGLRYEQDKNPNPETATFIELNGWQEIRKVLEDHNLAVEWQEISQDALMKGESLLLDDIAWCLSVYKEDDETTNELNNLDLPNKEKMIEALLTIRFDKFSNLSFKALRKILPGMASGLRYDQACERVGYHHNLMDHDQKQKLLPSLYKGRDSKRNTMIWNDDLDIPRNPVVLRAINQARKVINAIVRLYGSPSAVHIELARDLMRPLNERQKIQREQEKYRDQKQQSREHFEDTHDRKPSGIELEKWLLYKEQNGKCVYSLKPLDLDRVINDENYVQIDHVLPYSRSYYNSKSNRVLALTEENQKKLNRTPYEYLKDQGGRWRDFQAYVEGNKLFRQAKRNCLLRRNFDEEEAEGFRERNLNDTRYIARFLKSYIEKYLQLSEDQLGKSQHCVVLSGQLTSFLRARWGLVKNRGENDRHHALDAVVIAACNHSMIKRLADYSRGKELKYAHSGFVDPTTGEVVSPQAYAQIEEHFPLPWEHFREELISRLYINDSEELRAKMRSFGNHTDGELERMKPLFVSRAPNRRGSGAMHKETIYSRSKEAGGSCAATQKIPLSRLKLSDLDSLVDPHRNKKLYEAIRERLEEYDGKADKAFSSENTLRKPSKNGEGPVVRTVTKRIDKFSGIQIRGGLAENDSMPRLDIFTKGKKFYLVPVYNHQRGKDLPDKAIVAHKNEQDWIKIDKSFEFLFSLHHNDFIEVKTKKEVKAGYYSGCDRASGTIKLKVHDRDKNVGKNGEYRVGARTLLSFRKFHVDELGNIYPVKREVRKFLHQ
ncbi:MAG: type II CRISPR RNA-guided endonuclease Cas9 [Gammaproteobacteria bacterium]|nr:type II CRISPR RNA-guided endonuclease Cas9 [Gammaproteobacteria bacterium]